jgi:hypothetical protein
MLTNSSATIRTPSEVEKTSGRPSPVKSSKMLPPASRSLIYLITFSGPGVIGGSVPDGNYTLITLANKVNVLSGPPLTANDVNAFVRLFGDINGDGVVNALDKAYLLQAEANAASPLAPDFEYDGKAGIDKTDIAQFDRRYKAKLDPPKKAPTKFAGRRVHDLGAAPRARPPIRAAGATAMKLVDRSRVSRILPLPLDHSRHGRGS